MIDNLGLNAIIGRQDNNGEPLPTSLTYRRLVDDMVRVESQSSSSIIDINVFAQDPVLAAGIANEIARVYSEDRIDLATSQQTGGHGPAQEAAGGAGGGRHEAARRSSRSCART